MHPYINKYEGNTKKHVVAASQRATSALNKTGATLSRPGTSPAPNSGETSASLSPPQSQISSPQHQTLQDAWIRPSPQNDKKSQSLTPTIMPTTPTTKKMTMKEMEDVLGIRQNEAHHETGERVSLKGSSGILRS